MSTDIIAVLQFLLFLPSTNKSYSTINFHRSMLSMTLDLVDNVESGKRPLVLKLIKGCYNSNPPWPRYSPTWDNGVVFSYIRSLRENIQIKFEILSKKMIVLMAISTWVWCLELASVDRSSIIFTADEVKFSLAIPRKTHFSGQLNDFTFFVFWKKICV